eukprot:696374-Pelagomonas_calceolata.AAC.2
MADPWRAKTTLIQGPHKPWVREITSVCRTVTYEDAEFGSNTDRSNTITRPPSCGQKDHEHPAAKLGPFPEYPCGCFSHEQSSSPPSGHSR